MNIPYSPKHNHTALRGLALLLCGTASVVLRHTLLYPVQPSPRTIVSLSLPLSWPPTPPDTRSAAITGPVRRRFRRGFEENPRKPQAPSLRRGHSRARNGEVWPCLVFGNREDQLLMKTLAPNPGTAQLPRAPEPLLRNSPARGPDLVCLEKPAQSPVFLLALPTRAATGLGIRHRVRHQAPEPLQETASSPRRQAGHLLPGPKLCRSWREPSYFLIG